MNKFRHTAGFIFVNILIPIFIALFARLIMNLCIDFPKEPSASLSEDVKAYQTMISSMSEIFEWALSVIIGVLSYFIIASKETQAMLSLFQSSVSSKLIQTNAVVENPETKKIAITAKSLDFYERKIYEELEKYDKNDRDGAISVDVLRWYSFQDLLFSTSYLNYFFNRGSQIGESKRIIVVEKVCLATATFIFLNLKAGYKTYLISNWKFKQFYSKLRESQQKVLKGNPYLIKIQSQVKYGKYSTEAYMPCEVPKKDEMWGVFELLIQKSEEVKDTRDTFSIKDIEAILNGH